MNHATVRSTSLCSSLERFGEMFDELKTAARAEFGVILEEV